MKAALVALSLSFLKLSVHAQDDTPLYQKRFQYTNLPYQADTSDGERGRQFGYNRCNSTTEGQESLCQTAMINSIDDFCLWGPPEPNSVIGNTEGEAVAWCTKPGRGTRLIPQGALRGVQFMRTPDYVQVVGKIDQAKINIQTDDGGGEMDPHGADQRGNPLGGLIFSNAYPSNGGNNNTFQQVIEWHNFMGANEFCLKACDPAGANAAHFCEHIFDRIGCFYNAPADYAGIEGKYLSCEGESQDYPGVYTTNGVVTTYSQPPESLGEIQTMPYQPKVPSSSNCVTYTSANIYAALPSASGSASASSTGSVPATATASSSSGSASATSSNSRATITPSASASRSASASGASSTSSQAPNGAIGSSAGLYVPFIVGLVGIASGLMMI